MTKSSAKARTVDLPFVDVREQDNRAPTMVELDGGIVRRVVVMGRGCVSQPPATHLVARKGDMAALCGEPLCGPDIIDRHGETTKRCLACMAEASRMRAVIR
jgi:hypothetical protein